jgi:hypothetical protein
VAAKQADPAPSPPQPSKQPQTGPRALPLLLASATTSETQVQLALDAPSSEVDPGATFRVEIAAQLEDARLVLLDEQHAMVPARGTTDLGPITRFMLTPEPPLKPGTAYALRVDGAVGRDIHDHEGNAYAPVVLQLKTTGERPLPVTPAKKVSRRRGRR